MGEGLLNVVIIVVIIISLFFLGVFILKYFQGYKIEKPNQLEDTNQKESTSLNTLPPNQNNKEINNQDNKQISVNNPVASGGASGGGSGGGSSGGGETNGQVQTPESLDPKVISSSPCGSYFREYKICAGTCPRGICVNELNSCFCK